MIHYHGTPVGGPQTDVEEFLKKRHVFIPFSDSRDIEIAAEVCQSFAFDNGAFTAWKSGTPITDWSEYYEWVRRWYKHPGFDWAIIPDVIDGDEKSNDKLIDEWPFKNCGVPVWHLHESRKRLVRLCKKYPRVALGSSGKWSVVGRRDWWIRIRKTLPEICNIFGEPITKLHGLRMLNPAIFSRIPLASADSTNAVQNGALKSRVMGCKRVIGQKIIANRIETHQSCRYWNPNEDFLAIQSWS